MKRVAHGELFYGPDARMAAEHAADIDRTLPVRFFTIDVSPLFPL